MFSREHGKRWNGNSPDIQWKSHHRGSWLFFGYSAERTGIYCLYEHFFLVRAERYFNDCFASCIQFSSYSVVTTLCKGMLLIIVGDSWLAPHYGLGVIPQSKVNQYLQQSRLEQWLAVGDYVRIFLAWGFDINQTQTEWVSILLRWMNQTSEFWQALKCCFWFGKFDERSKSVDQC